MPVPLGTGALIVSTPVTVTTEPSAVPMMESAGAAPAGRVSTARSAVLQDFTEGTAPKSAAAKTGRIVTTSLANALAEPVSSGRVASRSALLVHLGTAASSCVSA